MKKRQKLRVLLLITSYGNGGAQRVFYDHGIEFNNHYIVEEAVFDVSSASRRYDSGLYCNELKKNDFLYKLGPIGRLISRARSLRQLVATKKFDVVISHMDGANWVNALSVSNAKKIAVVHGSIGGDGALNWYSRIFRKLIAFQFLYPMLDSVVGVSSAIERELREIGLDNCTTIQNWFEVERINQLSQADVSSEISEIFSKRIVLISSGRLASQKRHVDLLKIMHGLKKTRSDVSLFLLGDGPLKLSLLNSCDELDLSYWDIDASDGYPETLKDVYFLGYQTNPFALVAKATLFLFPSAWEGFPLAMCEAMICGAPVLASDCPTGPREIMLEDFKGHESDIALPKVTENGILLPVITTSRELQSWISAIELALHDEELRSNLRISGMRRMMTFDKVNMRKSWLELIKNVCEQ